MLLTGPHTSEREKIEKIGTDHVFLGENRRK